MIGQYVNGFHIIGAIQESPGSEFYVILGVQSEGMEHAEYVTAVMRPDESHWNHGNYFYGADAATEARKSFASRAGMVTSGRVVEAPIKCLSCGFVGAVTWHRQDSQTWTVDCPECDRTHAANFEH